MHLCWSVHKPGSWSAAILAVLVLAGGAGPLMAQSEDKADETLIPSLEEFVWRNAGRARGDTIPYMSLDGLLAALEEGEALIITRHQNQIIIRKAGSLANPYSDGSGDIRPER